MSSSTVLGGKALLEKADRCFRLSQFDKAFKSCDDAVKSSDFTASWKDKKRHEVMKMYIVYGRQSGMCASLSSFGLVRSEQALSLSSSQKLFAGHKLF